MPGVVEAEAAKQVSRRVGPDFLMSMGIQRVIGEKRAELHPEPTGQRSRIDETPNEPN